MRKVMFITLSLSGGGAERVVSVLASELAERNYPVSVVVYDRKNNEYKTSSKLIIYELGRPTGSNKLARLFNRNRELRKLINDEKPDIVIPFLALPTLHTWLAIRGLKCEFYSTVRNNPQVYPPQFLLRTLCSFITKRAGGIMLQTREQEQYFSAYANKCFVIPNPVKQEMLDAEKHYSQSIEKIITCGRLNEQKNHALLIRTVSNLIKHNKKCELLIYGEGSEQQALQRLIDESHMNDYIFLMGRTSQVKEVLLDADLFVLSSNYEGLPNALMEAMAVGLPCISTACPTGPSDLIQDRENGLLIPVRSEKALTEALSYAIENPRTMIEMGKKAKQQLLNYSAQNIADMLISYVNK